MPRGPFTLPEIKEGNHCSCAKYKAEIHVWHLIRKSKWVPYMKGAVAWYYWYDTQVYPECLIKALSLLMDSAASMSMMPIYRIENKEKPVLYNLWCFLDKVRSGIWIGTGNSVRFLHSLYEYDNNPVRQMHCWQKESNTRPHLVNYVFYP